MLTEDFEIIDPRFSGVVLSNVRVEKLWTGCRFAEGPAYFPAGKYLIWSDIPNDRILRLDETDGSVSVFTQPCGNQNGHSVDLEGRLICCEHQTRVVSRIERDGTRTVLADSFNGKRFNSPNDVVVRSDGSVWFTDPSYGIDSDYQGDVASPEIDGCHVYRYDPISSEVTVVIKNMFQPNGLAFSPDESTLYVSDTGTTHDPEFDSVIRAYSLAPDGETVDDGETFSTCTNGIFDGFRIDKDGRIWSSAGDGVHCIANDGSLIGKIRIPEVVGNVTFGGIKKNRLYICATTSLYAVYLNTRGVT